MGMTGIDLDETGDLVQPLLCVLSEKTRLFISSLHSRPEPLNSDSPTAKFLGRKKLVGTSPS